MPMPLPVILLYVVAINVVSIYAFAADKRASVAGRRRIRETDLLTWALIGGSPGALWARQHFRHKTRKQPFGARLETIAMLHAGIVLGLIVTWMTL